MKEVSVVIPTKNEERSIGICIEKIEKVFNEHQIHGEIIIADNSRDKTAEIANRLGTKVIVPERDGYGNAYRVGFGHASGDYIVMGDGDNTYDFLNIPELLEPLKKGEADLVLGSRFKGEIKNNLRIAEVPIGYYPRLEGSEPNLSSFSDGWRHLKHILLRAPTLLFLIPGFTLFVLGMLVVLLVWNPFNLWVPMFGIHSMIAGCLLAMVGYQIIFLGLFAKRYRYIMRHGSERRDWISNFVSKQITFGRGTTAGLVVFLTGFAYVLHLLLN